MIPDNLVKNQKFDSPILTPLQKLNMVCMTNQFLERKLFHPSLMKKFIKAEEYALQLFNEGQKWANEQGLILVDTKYEFGIYDGELIVIDEIHTPDSSRYWIKDEYQQRFEKNKKSKNVR